MKILIAEDEKENRYLLERLLQGYGHEVTATANGAEALEQALAQPPALIISDIMMPKMDGYKLCYECKQNDKLKDIPFVFYTATYTSIEDEKFALKLGARAYIRKPTDPETLIQMLRDLSVL
jgi:CheY-like chemotaxis protein